MPFFRKTPQPVLGVYPPPPLPSLASEVYKKAFTARKWLDPGNSRFEYTSDFVDNDRLDLGDAIIYAIVADYLYHKYPRLKVHYLSMIRQQLVKNDTLAMFAQMYHLESALEFEPGMEHLRNDTKVQADAFEAYIGSAQVVMGTEAVTKWITQLIEPYANQLHEYYRQESKHPSSSADGDSPDSAVEEQPDHSFSLCGFHLFRWFKQSEETQPLLQPPVASRGPASYSSAVTSQPVSHPAPVVKAYGSGHKGTPKKAGPQSILKKPSGTASPTTKSPKNTKQQTQPQPQTQAQPQTEASAEALAFADVERLQCLLCSRVLKDRDMLIRHGLESDRHRTNLQDAVLREAAIRKKAALQSTSQAMPSSKKQTHFEGTANATPSKAVHTSSMPAKSHGSPAPARGAPVAIKALAASSKTSSQHDILQGGVRFPPHIFDSMPAAPENADQRYFLLSCGGIDCQLWYSAVFDAEKKLLGHAVGAAKQEVIAAALQASKTKLVDTIDFTFSAQSMPVPPIEGDLKSPPGAMTRLLHLFRNPSGARVLWLSWFSPANDLWKDVCMVDGVFRASGKHVDPKIARKMSCEKTAEVLTA